MGYSEIRGRPELRSLLRTVTMYSVQDNFSLNLCGGCGNEKEGEGLRDAVLEEGWTGLTGNGFDVRRSKR